MTVNLLQAFGRELLTEGLLLQRRPAGQKFGMVMSLSSQGEAWLAKNRKDVSNTVFV